MQLSTPSTRQAPFAPIVRRAPERLLAWLVTGPLGHLYGTVADIAVFAARHWRDRARALVRGARPGV